MGSIVSILIKALVVLLLLCFMVTKGLDERCIGNAVDVHTKNLTVEYRNRTNICNLDLTCNMANLCIVASFSNINPQEQSLFSIMVFEKKNGSSTGIRLDIDGVGWRDTAISSRGSFMTIQFPVAFNVMLTLSIETFECLVHVDGESGEKKLPSYFGRYPKNLYMQYQITPLHGSTTALKFLDIDINTGGEDESKMVSVNGQFVNILEGRGKNISLFKTESIITIEVSTNKSNQKRGRGFSLKFKVCVEHYQEATGNFSLPTNNDFLNSEHFLRCSAYITQMHENVTVLSVRKIKNEQANDTIILEVYDGSLNNSTLLSTLDNLHDNQTETYAGTVSEMVLVYSYNRSTNIYEAVIQGNYSSMRKECGSNLRKNTTEPLPDRYFGKYANNYRCSYTMKANNGEYIWLLISNVHLADDKDKIKVINRDGEKMNTTLQVATQETELQISFESNNMSTSYGFDAFWTVCGGNHRNRSDKVTYKPQPPLSHYSTSCTYSLGHGDSESTILHVHLNGSKECIKVDDAKSLCVSGTLTVQSGRATVNFPSNMTNTFTVYWSGSKLQFNSTENEQMLGSFGYSDQFYPTNVTIEYVIKAEDHKNIALTFLYFYIGDSTLCGDEYVKISYTDAVSNSTNRTLLCGNWNSHHSFLSSSQVTLTFVTGSRSYRGFQLQYQSKSIGKDSGNGNPDRNTSDIDDLAESMIYVIVGSIIGLLVMIVIIGIIIYCCRTSKSEKKTFLIANDGTPLEKKLDKTTKEHSNPVYDGTSSPQTEHVSEKMNHSKASKDISVATSVNDRGNGGNGNKNDPIYAERPEGEYDSLNVRREKIRPEEITYSDGLTRVSMNVDKAEKSHASQKSNEGHTGEKPSWTAIHGDDGMERDGSQYTVVQKSYT